MRVQFYLQTIPSRVRQVSHECLREECQSQPPNYPSYFECCVELFDKGFPYTRSIVYVQIIAYVVAVVVVLVVTAAAADVIIVGFYC